MMEEGDFFKILLQTIICIYEFMWFYVYYQIIYVYFTILPFFEDRWYLEYSIPHRLSDVKLFIIIKLNIP